MAAGKELDELLQHDNNENWERNKKARKVEYIYIYTSGRHSTIRERQRQHVRLRDTALHRTSMTTCMIAWHSARCALHCNHIHSAPCTVSHSQVLESSSSHTHALWLKLESRLSHSSHMVIHERVFSSL